MKKHILSLIMVCLTVTTFFSQTEQIDQVDLTGILNASFDYDVVEDADSTLWALHTFIGAGIESGLMKYEGERWEAVDFPCNTCLKDITLSADGTRLLAAADTEGVFELGSNGEWTQLTETHAMYIAFTSDGKLKIVNREGVYTYDGGTVTPGNNAGTPNFFTLKGFEIDEEDRLWLIVSSDLYTYADDEGWVKKVESFKPVLIDYAPDGKLWTAENTGVLSYFDSDGYNFNVIKNVFPMGVKATALHIDDSNSFWVGVQGNEPGLTKYNEDTVVYYSSADLTGTSNPIDYTFVTKKGDIWAFENYNNLIAHVYEVEASEFVDMDQDGFNSDVDCDDNDASINPDAEEIANNDIDENCDGEMLIIDVDQDGFNSDVDCDDNDASINPDAEEIANNDIDENCDGEMLIIDVDQDGFNSDVDCDDDDASINPGAEEIADNGIDENCDGADLTSSIREVSGIHLKISPNPSRGNSRISFSETLQNPEIKILTLDGKSINVFSCSRPVAYFDINTSNFTPGVYLVNVVSQNVRISEKLIVK